MVRCVRYLTSRLERDLREKMVLLAGPRQCGKTTLAKSLLDDRGEYLNWDITKDRKVIRELASRDGSKLVEHLNADIAGVLQQRFYAVRLPVILRQEVEQDAGVEEDASAAHSPLDDRI